MTCPEEDLSGDEDIPEDIAKLSAAWPAVVKKANELHAEDLRWDGGLAPVNPAT